MSAGVPERRESPDDGEDVPAALALARRSPEVVRAKDKAAWLALFSDGASVEDPVGAGAYVGAERLSSFWDVFIAPQRDIVFERRRDFVHGDHVIRYVTISSVTPVSDEPFVLPALVEYRCASDRIEVLRAFWEPRHAVSWHAKQGGKGLGGLLKHGMRTARGLGLGATLGFSKALGAGLTRERGVAVAERFAASLSNGSAFDRLVSGASKVTVPGGRQDLIEPSADHSLEEVIIAGDHVACVALGGGRAVAALLQVSSGTVRGFTALTSAARVSDGLVSDR